MSRPNQSEWSSVIRFWLWRRSATRNSADQSRHLSTDVVTSSLKRTDDLRSDPPQAKSAAESPEAVERRKAREAVKVARDARIAERRATKLAIEAREAAASAAAQAADREADLKAEQETRDAEFAEQTAREAALEDERQAARDARYAARKARKRKGR